MVVLFLHLIYVIVNRSVIIIVFYTYFDKGNGTFFSHFNLSLFGKPNQRFSERERRGRGANLGTNSSRF